MNSVSIVCTSMQLVNCVEALNYFSCDDNTLVILAPSTQRESQILDVLNRLEYRGFFSKIEIIIPSTKVPLINIIREKHLLNKVSLMKYDYLVTGNYKLVNERYFISCAYRRNKEIKVVSVDDGLAICDIVKRRKAELACQHPNLYFPSKLVQLVFGGNRFLLRFVPEHIIFFSCYSKIDFPAQDTFVQNKYVILSKIYLNFPISSVITSEPICFIGQPLVRIGYLNKNVYSQYITDIINSELSGDASSFVYLAHPAEDINESLSKALLDRINVDTHVLPAEIKLCSCSGSIKLFGFFSSVLSNVKAMCPDIEVVALFPKEINSISDEVDKDSVLKAYQYLTNEGVIVRKI